MKTKQPETVVCRQAFDDNLWLNFDWRHAMFILGILTLAMFGDVLFSNKGSILSAKGLDLYNGEMSGLDFLYRELRNGNLSLWNPHVFSGTLSLAAALYPLNFLHLFLPLPQAINWGIALHVFLAGLFMYLWAAQRSLHPLACLMAAVIMMFSGTFFMHVFAGHVGNLCAMTWVPLILMVLDGIVERPSCKWVLIGIFAVTMQILTGQFQYVYYTAMTAVIYSFVRLPDIEQRWPVILGLFSIPTGGFLLSAFHLLPSLGAAGEVVRNAGVPVSFAAMFSFPPENILTLIAPFFFGDMQTFPYWGRCYLWEMSLFAGVIGFFLAVFGTVQGQIRRRYELPAMIAILLILALGSHTPLFRLLFDWLPGFDKFRGTSKFMFFASLFWIMLAGYGCDVAVRKMVSWPIFSIPLVAAAFLSGLSIWLYNTPPPVAVGVEGGLSLWNSLVSLVAGSRESYLPVELYKNQIFFHYARQFASAGLLVAAGTTFIVGGLAYLQRSSPRVIYILVLLAIVEMFVFGRLNRPTFSYQDLGISQLKGFYATHPGDYRVLSFINPNTAMSTGAQDIWGYGPVAMGRYVQFMAWTQGSDPDKATTYLKINQYHPLFKMLRLRYVFTPEEKGVRVREYEDWMPRISLVHDWKVAGSRDEIFQELGKPDFDPRRTVILEKAPASGVAVTTGKKALVPVKEVAAPLYVPADRNSKVAIEEAKGDSITVTANLEKEAILLVTDNFSRGWRVKPLKPGPQQDYEIMPANYTLMAIPLTAGEHLLRIEYRPLRFVIGAWISAISLFIFGSMAIFTLRRKKVKEINHNKSVATVVNTDDV